MSYQLVWTLNSPGKTEMKNIILAIFALQLTILGCHAQSQRSSYASEALSFRTPVHLPVGTHPVSVMIADANKDGRSDLIVANGGTGNLSIYLGDGKGGFTQAQGSPFPAGQNPSDMALGDFNGDGNLDVAIANHGVKLVTVVLGDGKGGFSFAPGSPFSVPSNPHPHGIAAADFNGDKKLDLAVESWGENKVLVMFGKGDGTFKTPGVKFDVGKMPYQRLRTADLSEDGNADIVTSNFEESSVSVLLGDGQGQFSRKDFPVPVAPFGIATGDFNGDHHLDIAIEHYSGQGTDPSKDGLSILFGDGKGSFTLAKGSPYAVGHYPATVIAGDLNGDGITDIAIPNNMENTVTIYLGGRDGIKQAGRPVPVGHGPECVAIGDLDGDGRADLVVANEEDNDVWVLLSK
jgi:hypothetical protein